MTHIGRYIIEAELGAGAMGVVYLAVDPRLERRIAVKTYRLPPGVSAEQKVEFQERFLREACAAAALSDPGIVAVYDAEVDSEHDVPFIAMEFIPGASLSELLASDEDVTPGQAFEIANTIAGALHVAHQAGIVHRDVKPANILIREDDGAAKLADFGVARLSTSELTRSGASLGSPAYMSPEAIRGAAVDGRSDLFSLAVILYEMLSGRRPFEGADLTTVAYAITHTAHEPISRRVGTLPTGLDAFFDRALAKDAERRFADGPEFRTALAVALREPTPSEMSATTVVSTGRSRRPSRPLVGATCGLLLVLGAWLLLPNDDVKLRLDARSSVASGTLTIQVDGDEVYSRELAGPQTGRRFFQRVMPRQKQETFEAWLKVPVGKHEILARVEPLGLRDTIVVDLDPGEQRTLRLVAGRTLGTPLSIRID